MPSDGAISRSSGSLAFGGSLPIERGPDLLGIEGGLCAGCLQFLLYCLEVPLLPCQREQRHVFGREMFDLRSWHDDDRTTVDGVDGSDCFKGET